MPQVGIFIAAHPAINVRASRVAARARGAQPLGMESTRLRDQAWFTPAITLIVVIFGGILVVAMLGSQVSGILSTVGSSVGGPYGGGEVDGGNVVDDGSGGDTTGGSSGSGSSSGSDGVVTAIPREDLLIIKTGSLTLQVDGISAAVTAATRQIDALGGFASGSQRSGTGQEAQAMITFRVPAAKWDEAMNALRGLAIEVISEQSTTEDVTGQVVDLGARVRNLEATEAALQAIMNKADLIKDVLSVQAELTTVRGQIEQLSAQKAHLEEQAAFSTLKAEFVLKPAPVLIEQQAGYDPASEVDAASASLVGVLQDVETAGIWFGIVWAPILLALAVVATIVIVIARRLRPATTPEPAGN